MTRRGAIVLAAMLAFAGPAFSAEAELAVPVTTIYPGDQITASMLARKTFLLPEDQRGSYARQAESLEGKVAKRTLLASQPIPMLAVEERRLALVGRQIRVVYLEGGLAISTFGSVLQAGAQGDVISVRMLDGGRVISGVVQADGSVRVGEGS